MPDFNEMVKRTMGLNNTHNLYGNEFIEICKNYCPGMIEDSRISNNSDIRMSLGISIFARFLVLKNKLYITPDICLSDDRIIPVDGNGEIINSWPDCDVLNITSDTKQFLVNRLTNLYTKYKQLLEELKVKNLAKDFI